MRSSKSIKKQSQNRIIVGIDEVGRGPIAGPVSVVALSMKKSFYLDFKKKKIFAGLHNSKALSEEKRNEWYKKIQQWKMEGLVNFAYTSVSAKQIDKIGISAAIKKCLKNNLKKLNTPIVAEILLDGSLYAPIKFKNQKTIIKGDESQSIIALASIVAKVRRDKYMVNLSKKYPKYGLEKHKGYGTLEHRKAIKEFGLSDVHRDTFCRWIR